MPGVIGAGLPQHVAAPHPFKTAQNVLQGVVERVPHMQRTRHIGRRDHDGEWRGVAPFRTSSTEGAAVLPNDGHTAFDIGGLVVFLDHDGCISGDLKRAKKPPRRAKSTRCQAGLGDKADVIAECNG